MGKKKYYCEFCDRFFNDDLQTRNKHFRSAVHERFKKEHYNTFRDPASILNDEYAKFPCRIFETTGSCGFGNACLYTHYSRTQLKTLEEEVQRRDTYQLPVRPVLSTWLKQEIASASAETENEWSHALRPELRTFSSLPLSLMPYRLADSATYEVASWDG